MALRRLRALRASGSGLARIDDTSYKWKRSSRSVKTSGPRLTPFVRSDAVEAILAEALAHPDREFSLAELGRRTGVSGSVVHREVGRLVESDILRSRHEGRNRLVRANDELPLVGPMGEIIDAGYGPVPVLRDLFEGVDGTERVMIYGSWAARRAGVGEAFRNDIDVLVTRLSVEEWAASEPTPFVATLRIRPTVDVTSGDVDTCAGYRCLCGVSALKGRDRVRHRDPAGHEPPRATGDGAEARADRRREGRGVPPYLADELAGVARRRSCRAHSIRAHLTPPGVPRRRGFVRTGAREPPACHRREPGNARPSATWSSEQRTLRFPGC